MMVSSTTGLSTDVATKVSATQSLYGQKQSSKEQSSLNLQSGSRVIEAGSGKSQFKKYVHNRKAGDWPSDSTSKVSSSRLRQSVRPRNEQVIQSHISGDRERKAIS